MSVLVITFRKVSMEKWSRNWSCYRRKPPPPNLIYSRFWYAFSMLRLPKFPPPYGGGLTFYYKRHDMNRFIPHVHRARPLNWFENIPNLAENRIEYVLLTTSNGNSIFFSAKRARPGSQKILLNGFTEWNFLRNKDKAYQNREWITLGGGGKTQPNQIVVTQLVCLFVNS